MSIYFKNPNIHPKFYAASEERKEVGRGGGGGLENRWESKEGRKERKVRWKEARREGLKDQF